MGQIVQGAGLGAGQRRTRGQGRHDLQDDLHGQQIQGQVGDANVASRHKVTCHCFWSPLHKTFKQQAKFVFFIFVTRSQIVGLWSNEDQTIQTFELV